MMRSANFALIASFTLHTWQITFVCWLSNLIFCSSQKPISRNRCVTSGGAESSLMRTAVPARTWLNGHTNGWPHSAGALLGSFIVARLRQLRLSCKNALSPYRNFGPMESLLLRGSIEPAIPFPDQFGNFENPNKHRLFSLSSERS